MDGVLRLGTINTSFTRGDKLAIESINGINIYTVTANDVKCKPSYFVEKSQSWVEGEKGEQSQRQRLPD